MNHTSGEKTNAQKHRFNIVDFVLITAVVACLLGIAIRYNLNLSMLRTGDKAVITVKISGLLNEYADALHEGDVFYYQTTDNMLGTLLSFETEPAQVRFVKNNGVITSLNNDDRINVICTLEAEGYDSENGFMVNGSTYIGAGSNLLVRSPYLETAMFVLDITSEP